MGAGHGQHVATLQDVFGQPLRAAGVGQAGVHDGFHQREFGAAVGQAGAADHVADHPDVRLQCQLVRAKTFDQVNAQGAQLVAHGRVDTGIAAGDGVPGLPRQRRQATHEGAANAQNMKVHGLNV